MSLSHQIKSDSPVAYWPLQETAGPVVDVIGGLSLTLNSPAAMASTGMAGRRSLDLGTSSGYASGVTSAALEPTNMTVEAWVNYNGSMASSEAEFLGKANAGSAGNGYTFGVTSGGNLQLVIMVDASGAVHYMSSASASSLISSGWHHIAGTYDDTAKAIVLYLDGVALSGTPSGPSGTRTGGGTEPFTLGRFGGFNGFHYRGQLADVAIYSTVLTADRIKAHYQAGIRSGAVMG